MLIHTSIFFNFTLLVYRLSLVFIISIDDSHKICIYMKYYGNEIINITINKINK